MIVPSIKIPYKFVKKNIACQQSGYKNVNQLHFHILMFIFLCSMDILDISLYRSWLLVSSMAPYIFCTFLFVSNQFLFWYKIMFKHKMLKYKFWTIYIYTYITSSFSFQCFIEYCSKKKSVSHDQLCKFLKKYKLVILILMMKLFLLIKWLLIELRE
jgi:hypothetical protein